MSGKHVDFIVRQADPLNGGPPPELLRRDFITPRDLFFVRNHGLVPEVQPDEYRLRVGGLVEAALSLSLEELRSNFTLRTVVATLQCAGNRRDELIAHREIPGEVAWGSEAISTARWTGVPLAQVLEAAGVREGALHVAFKGLDAVERHGRDVGFGGSLPIYKATASEVLLALEMNGEPLPPVHGFPLRVVAPGFIGARSVKWLDSITVQEKPSDNYFQQLAYRHFPPSVGPDTARWEQAPMIEEYARSAVISEPAPGASCRPGSVLRVHGYAIGEGGRPVERVEVSTDGGASWVDAALSGNERWTWCLWDAEVAVAAGTRELVARCHDGGEAQPGDTAAVWNFKGYLNRAWHRVPVLVS